jgi:hypothetical protein
MPVTIVYPNDQDVCEACGVEWLNHWALAHLFVNIALECDPFSLTDLARRVLALDRLWGAWPTLSEVSHASIRKELNHAAD